MTRALLFADKERTDDGYTRHDETLFAFLDRVDDVYFGRVRDLLNQWFAEIADDDKAERLRRDFQAARHEQVEGALWELYLHAALLRTPLVVEVEPGRAEGRQPDFRAWPPESGDDFFLEARAIGDRPSERARQRRLARAWDSVNEAAPPGFMVQMWRFTPGAGSPSGVRLRKAIVPWLQSLDRTTLRQAVEAGEHNLPEQQFVIDDWKFHVRAWPLGVDTPPPRHRLIGIGPVRTAAGGSRATLLAGLKQKSGRYELGAKPFVLAVANLHSFADEEDINSALFGEPALRILGEDGVGELVTENTRLRNGFFGTRHTRVSAILYALRLLPWCVGSLVPELWLNPWARNPLALRLPWARTVSVDGGGKFVVEEATVSPCELFRLSLEWPGPEQPFERRSSESK